MLKGFVTSDEFYAKLFCIHSSSYTVAGLYVRVPGVFSLFMDFFYCLANAGQPIFYPRVSFLYYDFCDTTLCFDIPRGF